MLALEREGERVRLLKLLAEPPFERLRVRERVVEHLERREERRLLGRVRRVRERRRGRGHQRRRDRHGRRWGRASGGRDRAHVEAVVHVCCGGGPCGRRACDTQPRWCWGDAAHRHTLDALSRPWNRRETRERHTGEAGRWAPLTDTRARNGRRTLDGWLQTISGGIQGAYHNIGRLPLRAAQRPRRPPPCEAYWRGWERVWGDRAVLLLLLLLLGYLCKMWWGLQDRLRRDVGRWRTLLAREGRDCAVRWGCVHRGWTHCDRPSVAGRCPSCRSSIWAASARTRGRMLLLLPLLLLLGLTVVAFLRGVGRDVHDTDRD